MTSPTTDPRQPLRPVFDHGRLVGFFAQMTDGSWGAETLSGVPFSFHVTPAAAEHAVVQRDRQRRATLEPLGLLRLTTSG